MKRMLFFPQLMDLSNWSVKYAREGILTFSKEYTSERISSLLTRVSDVTDIIDSGLYKRVTVRTNNGGVVLRDCVTGREIATKRQNRVQAGQFIISKIDARHGAYGLVSKELDGAIVTNDFPVFNINREKVRGLFLLLVSTTKPFVGFAKQCSSGTTNRKRLDVSAFLNQRLPLPSLKQQDELLSAYKSHINVAEEKELLSRQITAGITAYLRTSLSFEVIKKPYSIGLKFVAFEDVSRWDVPFLSSIRHIKSQYSVISISDCIKTFMRDEHGQSLRIDTSKHYKAEFYYIGMESVKKDSGTVLSMPLVEGSAIKSQTVRVPHGYFIYGKLRPYLNKYWRNTTRYTNVVCSSEFFCFSIDEDVILPDYFTCVLSSFVVQEQISDNASGARMPRINEEMFCSIKIPLPSRQIQQVIAAHITQQREKSSLLLREAKSLRETALADFEGKIYC